MELKTRRLYIREISELDYDFIYELETSEFTQKYESDKLPSKEEVDKTFADILESKSKDPREKYSLLVTRLNDHIPVGRVVIWQIDSSIKEWEIGWFVHPNHSGNGYATEVAKALLDFAFENLNAHRVQALCNEQNTSSENVMKKIGMQKEGTLRGVRRLNNKWYGMHVYSILDSDR